MGLQQVQGLSLQHVLSPQMQQSLHILQAPAMELRQLANVELARNPALEEVEPDPVERREETRDGLEDQWRLYGSQRSASESWSAEALERRQHLLDSRTRPPTLIEHLNAQLAAEPWSPSERAAANTILGNLDEDGYFRGRIEEAAYPLGLTVAGAEAVLRRIQELDPPGVAARNLGECLVLQLRRQGMGGTLAAKIAEAGLDDLAKKRFAALAKKFGVTVADVRRAAETIRGLEPRPGRPFDAAENPEVAPDLIVERDADGRWDVRLDDSVLPRLRMSNDFKDLLGVAGTDREAREFIREKIREGRFFLSCLEQRKMTLLAIGRVIVDRQQEFLEIGPAGLKPMNMNQVAGAVGVHETTVSRAVAGKFIATPHGLFEMRYFFTTGFTTGDGQAVSNESVRQLVGDIIKAEPPDKPLSDLDLARELESRGIQIARRTVAKYREQLGILPSHLRKSS